MVSSIIDVVTLILSGGGAAPKRDCKGLVEPFSWFIHGAGFTIVFCYAVLELVAAVHAI